MIKILKYVVLVYVLLCGLFYVNQQWFYFHPKKLPANHRLQFPDGLKYTESQMPFDSATVIDVIKFQPSKGKSKGVVLYFHGNRYNVEHYASYAAFFTQRGYECWMPDYPGFGRSTGELSIALLNEISLQLYKMARTKYAVDSILIYGKSLGSGLAANLAARRDCSLLMLETPYHSLSALTSEYLFMMPVKWLLKEDIETFESLKQVTAPVLVWHGTNDELIPLTEASRLMPVLKPQDRFYVVKGADHNSITKADLYRHSLDSAFAALQRH